MCGLAGLVMVAERPDEHAGFLSAYLGVTQAAASAKMISTPHGDFEVVEPEIFRSRFGTAPPNVVRGPRLAALRFFARDLAAAAATLQANGIAAATRADRIVVGPDTACGATLVFVVPGR